METTQQHTLTIRRTFAAAPADVFRAFTEPELMQQWWGPPGYTTPRCDMDVRVGGQYHLTMTSDDGPAHDLCGEFREIVPNERLAYTFIWQDGDHANIEMLVTLEFKPVDEGTELHFTQSKLPSEKSCEEHKHGWTASFDRLTDLVTS